MKASEREQTHTKNRRHDGRRTKHRQIRAVSSWWADNQSSAFPKSECTRSQQIGMNSRIVSLPIKTCWYSCYNYVRVPYHHTHNLKKKRWMRTSATRSDTIYEASYTWESMVWTVVIMVTKHNACATGRKTKVVLCLKPPADYWWTRSIATTYKKVLTWKSLSELNTDT